MQTICDGRSGETRLMQGNEAFARGALEAGLSVVGRLPGNAVLGNRREPGQGVHGEGYLRGMVGERKGGHGSGRGGILCRAALGRHHEAGRRQRGVRFHAAPGRIRHPGRHDADFLRGPGGAVIGQRGRKPPLCQSCSRCPCWNPATCRKPRT